MKDFLGECNFSWIGRKHALGNRDLAWMQRPGADASHEEVVAELTFTSLGIEKIAAS